MANNVNISLLLRTKGFTKGLANAKRQLTTFGQVSTTVGRTMQYALGGAFIAVGADAAKAAADFDLANRKLKALAGPEAAAGVEGLANTARQLGKNSIFTAAEVANLQVEMKKLGLSTKDVKELSDVTVRFATAMDTDAANAGSVLVKTLNKFKSSFEDYGSRAEAATKLSDQMANAILNSALTFDTLQNSLGYAGGEAEAAGFSFADTTAILAELANAGFEGSRAGTILRRIFINLAKTGTADLNDEFFKLITNQQEFADLIKITGARSAGGIASIQGLRDVIEEFAESNEKASGEVGGLYDAVDQSLIGRVKNLRSAIQELGIVFEKQFGRQLRQIISSLADFIRGIDATDAKAAGAVAGFLLITKVLKGMTTVVTNLAIAFVGKGGIGGLAKSFLRMGPASVAVGAFIAGFAIMRSTMNDMANDAEIATGKIDDMFNAFKNIGGVEDKFLNKVKSKSFSSEDEFRKAADERLQNLNIALDQGKKGAEETRKMLGITDKLAEDGERLVRSGRSIADVMVGFIGQQDDGLISGLNTEKLEKERVNYRKFLANVKNTMYYEKLIRDTMEVTSKAGTSEENTFWKTIDPPKETIAKVKDLIKIFEEAQNKVFGRTSSTEANSATTDVREYAEALGILADEERKLAAEKSEIEARGGKVSDRLKEEIKDNKLLQDFYNAQAAIQLEILDTERKRVEFMEKRVGLEATAYGWLQKQKQKAAELAEQRKQEQADYALMGEGMQGIVDRLKDAGYTMRESLTGAQRILVNVFNTLISVVDGLANAFARGIVEPSIDMADAMKEWGRQLIQGIVQAIAKVVLLTTVIAVGNALTGGGVTALLKLMAGAGQSMGGAVNIANSLAGGGSLGGAKSSFTGYVAGSDLVLTTSRGINANDRLYG